MSVDEIIDRERKGAFGFTDDRRCLFTYGDFRRLLIETSEAWKREHGNAAAMREAVEAVVRALSESNDVQSALLLMQAEAKCKAALSKPPRNCDVGTAREQSGRFDKFCFANRTYECGCGDCPLVKDSCCELAWAQMPYESEASS